MVMDGWREGGGGVLSNSLSDVRHLACHGSPLTLRYSWFNCIPKAFFTVHYFSVCIDNKMSTNITMR